MKILFIIPYPSLQKTVELVIDRMELNAEIEIKTQIMAVEDISTIEVAGVDAIIARGYTAGEIQRRYPHIINVELSITSYDVFRAVQKIKRLYAPKCIGYCGGYSYMEESSVLDEWLGCPVRVYYAKDSSKIKSLVEGAYRDKCDVVLGGYSAIRYARRLGMQGVILETGTEAVERVLRETIRSITIKRNEQVKAEMYRLITKNSKEGMMFVDLKGNIGVDNQAAQEMVKAAVGPLCQKPLLTAFPALEKSFRRALETRKNVAVEVLKLSSGRTISTTITPVISNGLVYGAVINMVDISLIQALEGSIRSKLSERGLQTKYDFQDIVFQSKVMQERVEEAKRFAKADANIIIVGETGTGKEVFAQSIHNYSSRKNGPFVAINCAALPENLLESELFGYVEGAFTGTRRGGKMGLMEQAHKGTLFLDEISEIPIALQSKLLRALQEREVRRIGADKVVQIDLRIIAATNRNLKEQVLEGKFRKDLLYRLDVLRLVLPPLRKREGDVELLFKRLLKQLRPGEGLEPIVLTEKSKRFLEEYPFEGNIRELRNLVERLCVLHRGGEVRGTEMLSLLYPEDYYMEEEDPEEPGELSMKPGRKTYQAEREALQKAVGTKPGQPLLPSSRVGSATSKAAPIGEAPQQKGELSLLSAKEQAEYTQLQEAFVLYKGHKQEMALALGINRSTLWRKLKKYNID